MIYESIDSCRICESSSLEQIFSYQTHVGDAYRIDQNQARAEPWVPLTLVFCVDCGHLQILETLDFREVGENYFHRSSVSKPFGSLTDFEVARLATWLPTRSSSLVIEVGSGDGTALLPFKTAGFRVLGIEPSSGRHQLAENAGIETINSVFTQDLSEMVFKSYGHAGLIRCDFLFANVADVRVWAQAFASLLGSGGILAITTGYHPMQFGVNMFEYVNHDHLHYFSVTSLSKILSEAGLEIFDVEVSAQKGGSIRVIARKAMGQDAGVNQWLQREKWQRIGNLDYYVEFKKMMYKRRDDFWAFARSQGLDKDGNWVGVGASISTTHLRDFYELDHKLRYLVDDDSNKIGRFSPGAALEVKPIAAATKGNAALLPVILAWQHENVLKRRLLEENYSGPVVDVLPRPRMGNAE